MKVQLPAFPWMKTLTLAQLWRNEKSDERHQRDVFLQSVFGQSVFGQSVFGHYNKGARQVSNLHKSEQVLLESASGVALHGGGCRYMVAQVANFGWCRSQAAGGVVAGS